MMVERTLPVPDGLDGMRVDAGLSRLAAAQNRGSFGANAGEIDGCVSGGIEPAKMAIGLFQQKRGVGARAQNSPGEQKAKN